MNIQDWISQNKLSAIIDRDAILQLNNNSYLILTREEGEVIFDEGFEFSLTDDEQSFLMENGMDLVVFEFGSQWYWSNINDVQLNVLKYIGEDSSEMKFEMPYLGIHGEYELCNGSRLYSDWCKKAKFIGYSALGICEYNTLAGTLSFQQACKDAGIKSILGETVNVKVVGKENDFHKVKLYAIDYKGWVNLLNINAQIKVFNDGYVEDEYLFERSEGLICVLSEVDYCFSFAEFFKDNLYFQLDFVEWSSSEKDRAHLIKLKKYFNQDLDRLKPVIICDSYYLDKEDNHIKKNLNFIGKTAKESQSSNQHLKSIQEINDQIVELSPNDDWFDKVFFTALENTVELSDKCNFEIKLGELHLPQYEMTVEETTLFETNKLLFDDLINRGFFSKRSGFSKEIKEYQDRLVFEIDIITRGGFIDYFLILADIMKWCKSQDILTSTGRGSSAGSLVAYLLDITQIDPLKHDLLFERFLNESRIGKGLPDIDSDFPSNRRDDIKRYMEQRYGEDYVTSIGTYGTFKIKSVIKDFSRVYGIDVSSANFVNSMLDDNISYVDLFKECCNNFKVKDFVSKNYKVIESFLLVANQVKNSSVHAAGVIIVPKTYNGEPMKVYDWMPVKKIDGVLVSEWDGVELDSCGFLKEDILGLTTLDKLYSIFELVNKNHGVKLNFNSIDLEDERVYALFKLGYTKDVFQFGTDGLSRYCKDMQPDIVDELIDAVSLYRPGVMESGSHYDYIKIKFKKKKPAYDYMLEDVTKDTKGIFIYQEQVMKAMQVLGGFSLTEADAIRKAMGKKDPMKMEQYKTKFIEGAIEKKCDKYEAIQIWNKLETFAGYGFNKCISGDESFYKVGINLTAKSAFHPTIKEMFNIKNNKSYAELIGKLPLNDRYNKKGYGSGFSLSDKNRLIRNKIVDIRHEGKKDIFRVTLISGKFIDATMNHKFPTKNGELILAEIKLGDYLMINDGYEKNDFFRFGVSPNHNYPTKGLLVEWEEIIFIDYLKTDDVYDVEMEAPYHTFVTKNNVVTCNSHATAYTYLGYFAQWLKVHYPLEFWTVALNFAKQEDIRGFISEMHKISEVKVLPPDINNSTDKFEANSESKTIYWSIGSVSFVGDKVLGAIISERTAKGRFFDFSDFLSRINRSIVNKRCITNLIIAGCFDKIESIESPSDRSNLLKKFIVDICNDVMPEEFKNTSLSWKNYFWTIKQKELTGFGDIEFDKIYSGSLKSRIKNKKASFIDSISFQDDESIGQNKAIVGILAVVTQRNSKNGPFAQLIVNCNDDEVTCLIWNEVWEAEKEKLFDNVGKIICVTGDVKFDAKFHGKNVLHSNSLLTQIEVL